MDESLAPHGTRTAGGATSLKQRHASSGRSADHVLVAFRPRGNVSPFARTTLTGRIVPGKVGACNGTAGPRQVSKRRARGRLRAVEDTRDRPDETAGRAAHSARIAKPVDFAPRELGCKTPSGPACGNRPVTEGTTT